MSHAIDPSGPPPRRRLFSRKPKAEKGPKKTGRMKQVAEVFKMTRRNDPSVVWFMLLAFVGIIAVGLLIGLLINNVITLMIIAIPLAFLATIVPFFVLTGIGRAEPLGVEFATRASDSSGIAVRPGRESGTRAGGSTPRPPPAS